MIIIHRNIFKSLCAYVCSILNRKCHEHIEQFVSSSEEGWEQNNLFPSFMQNLLLAKLDVGTRKEKYLNLG